MSGFIRSRTNLTVRYMQNVRTSSPRALRSTSAVRLTAVRSTYRDCDVLATPNFLNGLYRVPQSHFSQQTRLFSSFPARWDSERKSASSTGPDLPHFDIPLPPEVELPPLPPGYRRLSPDIARVAEKKLDGAMFFDSHKDRIWMFVYLGSEKAAIEVMEKVLSHKTPGLAGFASLKIMGSLFDSNLEDEAVKYYGLPVNRDIIENQRWKEWKNLTTTKSVPVFHSPVDQPESLTNTKEPGVGEKGTDKIEERGEQSKQAQKKSQGSETPPSPQQARSNKNTEHGKGPDNKTKDEEKKGEESRRAVEIFGYALAVGTIWALVDAMTGSTVEREITWQELKRNFLDKGLVERLVVRGKRVRVDLNIEATRAIYPDSVAVNPNFHYYFSIGSPESFEMKLDSAQDELGIPSSDRIPVTYREEGSGFWGQMFVSWGSTLLFIGLLAWMSRGARNGAGGGILNISKSKAKRFNHESAIKIKFSDVAGADEAKVEIMEFVSFLKSPEQFQRLGAKIPRGAILSGPPGTGKTLLAKATAGESNVPFFSVSGSEFVEMFVGVGASRVRDLFATARKNAPCIIFIDEIDAIGKKRSERGGFGGNDEREATLNQILTEMDGFNTDEQVVVLAGTNRPDILDKALTRPGRFDRQIVIDRPTMKGRADIFRVHLRKILTKEDMDHLCGRLSALTPGFAGADIANAVNEAALIAARANAETVTMVHFEQAIERVIAGLERKSLVLSKEEKRTVAYHEAGHAICGWYFEHADPLLKVSIIPRGQGALGYAQYLPAGDAYLMTVKQLMDRMAMTLGGRVSEELHFDSVTTGASDDFKKVTQMATTMVTQWGMSEKLGPLHFGNDQQQFQKPFAELTAQTIDAEVRRIVDEAYKQCKDLLITRKREVGLIAEELLSKEVLTRDDLVRILGPRQWKDKEEFSKYFYGEEGGKHAPPPFPTENTDTPSDAAPTGFKGQE